jgi:lysophospholipase L1-like esterase
VAPATKDWRAFHIGAADERLSGHDPLTVFDSFLLWRLNPGASPQITPHGFRGVEPRPKGSRDFLIVALGDSNTAGPLDTTDHWPGFLQGLVRLNRSPWRIQVVNAGVYGYSSLQGLRRLEQVLAYRPDLVYFSFGANDAHRVRVPDAVYAQRARWLRGLDRSRLAPPLAHLLWRILDAGWPWAPRSSQRVPLPAYRSNLEAFVSRAREAGAVPVLLTRPYSGVSRDPEEWLTYASAYNEATRQVAVEQGVACVDVEHAFRDKSTYFVDDSHLDRAGYQRMARLLSKHLAALGILETDYVFPTELDLGLAPDSEPALREGFWPSEAWGEDRGRWTRGEAALVLERREDERGLLAELSFHRPGENTTGRIEVNGRLLLRFSEPSGRRRWRLDLSGVLGRQLEIRIRVDRPSVPALAVANERDRRALGVFVHRLGLVQAATPLSSPEGPFLCDSAIDLGVIADDRPELGSGFWPREAWADGGGRWTRAEATVLLERRERERALLLDLSLQNPSGMTRARVEVNRELLLEITAPNGRVRRWLDVSRVPGRRLTVRFNVESSFVPREEQPGSHDARRLGLFVRSLRLAGGPDLP